MRAFGKRGYPNEWCTAASHCRCAASYVTAQRLCTLRHKGAGRQHQPQEQTSTLASSRRFSQSLQRSGSGTSEQRVPATLVVRPQIVATSETQAPASGCCARPWRFRRRENASSIPPRRGHQPDHLRSPGSASTNSPSVGRSRDPSHEPPTSRGTMLRVALELAGRTTVATHVPAFLITDN